MSRPAGQKEMVTTLSSANGISLGLGVILLTAPVVRAAEPAPGGAQAFFKSLILQAQQSAGASYAEPTASLPESLKQLSYDDHMRIRFRHEKSLWFGQPSRFQVQFFHPGYNYREPVQIHILEEGQDHEIRFSPEMFDYGGLRFPEPLPKNLFLAGLRLLYPVNQPQKMDEVAVFLGSSYFRVLGAGQVYGASARALAIDTAESSGEEFPRFTAFWIEKPGKQAEQIRLYARLESRRVAGAYQFLVKPGGTTVVDVEGCLFLREAVGKLGLAPLTSMFVFGENRTRYFPDFRPEVHDSDGLLGFGPDQTWEWRPLVNPAKVHRVSSLPGATRFGLFQRDRDGSDYQDLEAHYEDRPSYWIDPEGDWGAGRVELVEIPTTEERNDNIVAYWVRKEPVPPGTEFRFRYQLRAFLADADHPPSALFRVDGTRLQQEEDGRTRFVVDFAGGTPAPNGVAVEGKVEASRGKLENVVTQRNALLDGWRMFFDLTPGSDEPVLLRAWLGQGNQVVSETWLYQVGGN